VTSAVELLRVGFVSSALVHWTLAVSLNEWKQHLFLEYQTHKFIQRSTSLVYYCWVG